jgi:sugar phosphate isomerase/epimerase
LSRPVTISTGQWWDVPFETLCRKMAEFGYDGLELACWGDHFDVERALSDDSYLPRHRDILEKYGLKCYAISNHNVGQAICDVIDEKNRFVLPAHIWGDGREDAVRRRASENMQNAARAAARFDAQIVTGFTGSPIWRHLFYWRPDMAEVIERGYRFFAEMWNPILDVFQQEGVKFALEVHPTEIAFDSVTSERAVEAIGGRAEFGFNYDPSHLGYQGVDYVGFIRKFGDRIYHVHMKDVYWSPTRTQAGVFGGHLPFGDPRRYWDFRSVGRGLIDFEAIIQVLNEVGYDGPLSVEFEDPNMDREDGAREGLTFVRNLDFTPSKQIQN